MQILFLINSDNHHRVLRIQQLLGKQQATFHHSQPFTMTVTIISIHIIIVVFPIGSTTIVRRVYIDTIHLLRIKISQELESMKIVCLYQRVPKVAIWSILNRVHIFEARVNWLTILCHANEVLARNLQFLTCYRMVASSHPTAHTHHLPKNILCEPFVIIHLANHLASTADRIVIEQSHLWHMILKHKSKLFMLGQLFHLLCHMKAKFRILYSSN